LPLRAGPDSCPRHDPDVPKSTPLQLQGAFVQLFIHLSPTYASTFTRSSPPARFEGWSQPFIYPSPTHVSSLYLPSSFTALIGPARIA
jgi:hypothetical protein